MNKNKIKKLASMSILISVLMSILILVPAHAQRHEEQENIQIQPASAPSISAQLMKIILWSNNYTNDNRSNISIPHGTTVKFNVTTNYDVDWYYSCESNSPGNKSSYYTDSKNIYCEINFIPDSPGTYWVRVGGANSTYGYAEKQWNVSIIQPKPYFIEEWNKTVERAYQPSFVQQISDKTGYIVGFTGVEETGDDVSTVLYWSLMKTDNSGNKEWIRKYFIGGPSTSLSSGQQTKDGGYIIAGSALPPFSPSPINQLVFIKTDSSGKEKWNKTFGEGGATFVQQTKDNGYILAGYKYKLNPDKTRTQYSVAIKTDSEGNKKWEKWYSKDSSISHGNQTKDGGYIFTENNDISGYAWQIKTYPNGTIQWHMSPIYKSMFEGRLKSVQQTSDGGYIFAGIKKFNNEFYQTVIKTYPSGYTKWERLYDKGQQFASDSIKEIPNNPGQYIFAGTSYNNYTYTDNGIVMKINSSGHIIGKFVAKNDSGFNSIYPIIENQKNKYILSGRYRGYGVIIKLAEIKENFIAIFL